jgi:hypothetical protein
MDTIFPSRFFDRLRNLRAPEKRLMAAILEDAVHVYRDHAAARTQRDRGLLREIEAWFSSDESTYPFSFLRISHELGIDPGWVRQVLAGWRSYQQAALRTDLPRIAHTERLAS